MDHPTETEMAPVAIASHDNEREDSSVAVSPPQGKTMRFSSFLVNHPYLMLLIVFVFFIFMMVMWTTVVKKGEGDASSPGQLLALDEIEVKRFLALRRAQEKTDRTPVPVLSQVVEETKLLVFYEAKAGEGGNVFTPAGLLNVYEIEAQLQGEVAAALAKPRCDYAGSALLELLYGHASWARSVFAADLDGDGDLLDVLSASSNDNKIAWYRNDLSTTGAFTISTNASGAFAADLEGDGDLDVLSASFYDNKIAWYRSPFRNAEVGTPAVLLQWTDASVQSAQQVSGTPLQGGLVLLLEDALHHVVVTDSSSVLQLVGEEGVTAIRSSVAPSAVQAFSGVFNLTGAYRVQVPQLNQYYYNLSVLLSPVGQVVLPPAIPVYVGDCPAGSHWSPSSSVCLLCLAVANHDTACMDCAKGRYSKDAGSQTCTVCGNGSVAPSPGLTTCSTCQGPQCSNQLVEVNHKCPYYDIYYL